MSQRGNGDNEATRKIRHRGFYFALIFLLAMGTRTCAVVTRPETPVADAADYHEIASRLAEGHGYVNSAHIETAWRPPGYPAFLATIYRVTGPQVAAATYSQILVGSLTVLLLVIFGATILDHHEAIIAGLIAAVYPGFVWLPRLLLSENLSLLFTIMSLWAAVTYLKTSDVWWLALFGLVAGLNTLIRGGNLAVAAFIGAGICVVMIKRRTNWRQIGTGLALGAAAFILVLTPWTIRNYRVFHRFVPIATQDGLTLYGSYWPPQKNGRLIWGNLPGPEDPNIVAAARAGNEIDASEYLERVTVQRLRAQPSYYFRLIPSKLISLVVPLDWEILPHAGGATRSINFGYLLIILPAALGFVFLWKNPRPHQWLLWVIPGVVLAQSVIFYGSPRFRLPAELIAILLAATGLANAWGFLKRRRTLLR